MTDRELARYANARYAREKAAGSDWYRRRLERGREYSRSYWRRNHAPAPPPPPWRSALRGRIEQREAARRAERESGT